MLLNRRGKQDPIRATEDNAAIVYYAYSENIGDTSAMAIDAITGASLNAATANTMGNTQVMAEVIRERTGAPVYSLVQETPYDPTYAIMQPHVIDELRRGYRPKLAQGAIDLEARSVLFLGVPVWDDELPPAVRTFLDENDLSHKIIVPFGIHLGSGFGRDLRQIRAQFPQADVRDGLTLYAATSNDEVRHECENWLNSILEGN